MEDISEVLLKPGFSLRGFGCECGHHMFGLFNEQNECVLALEEEQLLPFALMLAQGRFHAWFCKR